MAKVLVRYTATVLELIDWPDDEMEHFNEENLVCNIAELDGDIKDFTFEEILSVKLNGKEYNF